MLHNASELSSDFLLTLGEIKVEMSSSTGGKSIEVLQQDEPSHNQYLKHRGRVPSPPKKAWLYDCEGKKLTIHKREELERSMDPMKMKWKFLTVGFR